MHTTPYFLCRICKAGGDVIALIEWLDGCSFVEAVATLTGETPRAAVRKPAGERIEQRPPGDTPQRPEPRQQAARIWQEAVPIAGTLAETYLRRRRLEVLPDASRVTRFHGNCPFGSNTRHPCLVALFRSIATDEPQAIMRTALTPAGEKIGRMALGSIGGSAVKLSDDQEVTHGLVVGEGVESTLAGMGLGFAPAWALGSANGIRQFPVLAGIEALTILVDNDASGTGQAAARECSARWTAAGREVFRAVPLRPGEDFNDVVILRARRAVA
jgi:putative DNA primase/helicase